MTGKGMFKSREKWLWLLRDHLPGRALKPFCNMQ